MILGGVNEAIVLFFFLSSLSIVLLTLLTLFSYSPLFINTPTYPMSSCTPTFSEGCLSASLPIGIHPTLIPMDDNGFPSAEVNTRTVCLARSSD